MNMTIWLLNLGSMVLGMTLAMAILFIWGAHHTGSNGPETCLISIVCVIGFSFSVMLYVSAYTM